jgi:hypothetical protein
MPRQFDIRTEPFCRFQVIVNLPGVTTIMCGRFAIVTACWTRSSAPPMMRTHLTPIPAPRASPRACEIHSRVLVGVMQLTRSTTQGEVYQDSDCNDENKSPFACDKFALDGLGNGVMINKETILFRSLSAETSLSTRLHSSERLTTVCVTSNLVIKDWQANDRCAAKCSFRILFKRSDIRAY